MNKLKKFVYFAPLVRMLYFCCQKEISTCFLKLHQLNLIRNKDEKDFDDHGCSGDSC